MTIQLVSHTIIGKVKGKNSLKYKYRIRMEDGREYMVLKWDGVESIVYDACFDEEMSKYNWCYNKRTGYVYAHLKNNDALYMHRAVAHLGRIQTSRELSIDHIAFKHKTDNRLDNLRATTQSVQNSNRANRSDKKPPCQELQDKGIEALPRYVRWDASEKKFIIERHPILLKEADDGLRKKPTMSGSKAGTDIKRKYDDIINKLKGLDDRYYTQEHFDFEEKQKKLEYDYFQINDFVNTLL